MNAKNLFLTCITGLLLSCGNLVMADDVPSDFAVTTVNINEADAKTLSKMLDGVGMRKAQDIIAYREKNGRFFLAEELSAVKGIGRTTVIEEREEDCCELVTQCSVVNACSDLARYFWRAFSMDSPL